jgi:transcriptional regulator with XRE-family HTH domain
VNPHERGDVLGGRECGPEHGSSTHDSGRRIANVKFKKNGGGQFDVAALHSALDSERMARNLNWKEVSAESGVSASTLTRLSKGRRPDVDSLAALTTWLGISADRFMMPRVPACRAASSLTQISAIIREDPNLNPDAAVALEELIKATYARLRDQKEK